MGKRFNSFSVVMLSALMTMLLASCAQQPKVDESAEGDGVTYFNQQRPELPTSTAGDQNELVLSQEVKREPEFFVREGSGEFINRKAQARSHSQPAKGDITLNFEAVDLREVVKVIFEEILRENYLIDDKVQGKVTIHTTYPVSTESVLPILENILQMNGAVMVRNGALYKILPAADLQGMALKPSVGQGQAKMRAGQGVQIVPLKYISAVEMKKILESFTTKSEQIRIDPGRNLMILSGSYQKINNLLQTIKMFDVDWLSGMSFGLIPLKFTDAKTLTDELKNILGDGDASPLGNMIKLIPVERLGAVMVISQQPKYIDEARRLIAQFDQGSDKSPDRRLYVHHLKNGKAENIASILQSIFGNEVAATESAGPLSNSDPLLRSNVRSPTTTGIDLKNSNADREAALTKDQPTLAADDPAAAQSEGTKPGGGAASTATIIADPDNNAILVMASPKDYQKIKATITRLDVAPKQVMIEATIAEVQLSDNLSYGVRWFFNGSTGGGRPYQGGLGSPLPDSVGGDGFALGLFNSLNDLKVFFDILENESSVKFLSAPQIMVIDNQTASFRVGDQIPIVTRSSQSTTDPNAPIVSEVQFRDTGTLLQITPRINEGGMVTLEVSQEVSTPGSAPAIGGGGNVAISQRTIESTVVVHDGQTVVLGGLIRENTSSGQAGIPGLMHIPLLGSLFSSTTKDVSRTELIITLTPKVVRNPQEAFDISQELRDKIKEATLFQDDFYRRRAVQ
ncbi:MAG: type II secretion system protein GspD [gamma proteobacterium symbiont of Stewartia floridana]|nr:MAG: type II secretion system protein GspD [gamma proteobacterium symbiont of Stewartia floridana]RLW63563.1 MAG: type II secretion system protein GspD [gamma proteobacterium symbiont of Stewartia floridana]